MNVSRDDKISVTVTPTELVGALRAAYPNEFLLNQLPSDGRHLDVKLIDSTGALQLTYQRRVGNDVLTKRRTTEPPEGPGAA